MYHSCAINCIMRSLLRHNIPPHSLHITRTTPLHKKVHFIRNTTEAMVKPASFVPTTGKKHRRNRLIAWLNQ